MVVAIISHFYPWNNVEVYYDCPAAERFGSFKTSFAMFEVFYVGF